jgi:dTDP-4-dehydrorhamnose reductase
VTAAHRRAAPPAGPRGLAGDVADASGVARLLDEARADAVVHAAVLSRAQDCEARPDEAEWVNARLPGLVAEACRQRGVRLVALSTDLVFAGDRSFASENDPPGPCSRYGRTKRAGELAVLDACPQAAVARVALVLGRGHGSRATSSESVARALRAGRPLKLFTDEYRTPVDPDSVEDAVARLLLGTGAGLYHLGGPERLSRYELGLRVARVIGLGSDGIVASLQADHQGPDRRAPDVSLDSGRARRELGWEPRALDAAIRDGRA